MQIDARLTIPENPIPRICDVVPKDALLKMARDSFEPCVYAFVEKIINVLYGPAWGDGGDA